MTDLTKKTATKVESDRYGTVVTYHATEIVTFNKHDIVLRNGGYRTVTTKRRMNQVSDEFGLGFRVFQKDHDWFVDYKDVVHKFFDGMGLLR